MKLEAAEKMLVRLMTKHTLIEQGWTYKFDNGLSRLGVTKHHIKQIGLSTSMVLASPADYVKRTILHEIAHALLPHHVGHDAPWQRLVERIGGVAERTSDNPYVTTANHKPTAILRGAKGAGIGSKLRLPNGLELRITNRARVNFHAITPDGKTYTIRIDQADKYLV